MSNYLPAIPTTATKCVRNGGGRKKSRKASSNFLKEVEKLSSPPFSASKILLRGEFSLPWLGG